ncbi:MAG TPA: SOS response-associated peptidase family protein [Dyella sp.]|nr:SOS response-associated peptidase family protein [Dyella sp.]
MCYSAQVWADWQRYRKLGGELDVKAFARLIDELGGSAGWIRKLPKATRDSLLDVRSAEGMALARAVREANRAAEAVLHDELRAQGERRAGAEVILAGPRPTRKAANDQRVATDKMARAQRDLDDLSRTESLERDRRIYPGMYAPVLVAEGDRTVIQPMRYQCRPAGKPAFFDARFPGTYNARRDNLEGFWKAQFGHTHALMVVDTFYENVEGADGTHRVLQFTPRDREPMLVACLWSRWTDPAGKLPDLLSFAAITDDPEPEVAAAGHDRTIINLKPEHVDAWLRPNPSRLAELYAIFDDKRHPYYEHRIAA